MSPDPRSGLFYAPLTRIAPFYTIQQDLPPVVLLSKNMRRNQLLKILSTIAVTGFCYSCNEVKQKSPSSIDEAVGSRKNLRFGSIECI